MLSGVKRSHLYVQSEKSQVSVGRPCSMIFFLITTEGFSIQPSDHGQNSVPAPMMKIGVCDVTDGETNYC